MASKTLPICDRRQQPVDHIALRVDAGTYGAGVHRGDSTRRNARAIIMTRDLRLVVTLRARDAPLPPPPPYWLRRSRSLSNSARHKVAPLARRVPSLAPALSTASRPHQPLPGDGAPAQRRQHFRQYGSASRLIAARGSAFVPTTPCRPNLRVHCHAEGERQASARQHCLRRMGRGSVACVKCCHASATSPTFYGASDALRNERVGRAERLAHQSRPLGTPSSLGARSRPA